MSTPTVILLVLGGLALAVVVLARVRARTPAEPVSVTALEAAGRLDADTVAQMNALIGQGQMIQAIKQLRDATGVGLRDAKGLADGLAAGSWGAPPPDLPSVAHDDPLLEVEARAVREASGSVTAADFVRRRTGWSLEQAQAYVQALGSQP